MKKVLFGMAIGIMITLSTATYAADSIQALLFPAKIKINGTEKQLDSEYQILNVNGHAYVPIRYVAENTGINIGYDDNTQTISLAFGNPPIQDKNNTIVSVSNLIATTYDKYLDSTKVTGHLTLNTSEPEYVNADLEFYDISNKLLGTVKIDGDFNPGINKLDTRSSSDVTNFSNVLLKVQDTHPAMKSHVKSLFEAAMQQDSTQIERIINTLTAKEKEFLLLDFIKWSSPYNNDLRSYILPYILKQNVNVNLQDKASGKTALIYSSDYAIDLINPLIDAGADVKIKAKDGTTALILLASKGRPDLVKLLLDKGADPNGVGINGYTPLLSALRPMFGHYTSDTVKTVEYLLNAGANVDVRLPEGPEGQTPLMIIKVISEPDISAEIKKMLIEHGAK
ncbi:ankyrin repeat domain-containing protein [Paenibacillus sedimenti]|uniref:Ankyrin repeat domain-containing protein n=1 Tax=Paenibacillus sedimenti TaxID=2770274 RepID=A0A926KLL3_9BACL|nr:ankyrin repeat domain-containing protein [Paenibacillus sedimenti]MBD0379920.1 ankyrin repeat domain-containing protein [Paenibacillus sedimenti]